MKIVIIGASGLVGSNCMQVFSRQGYDVYGTYFSYPVDGLHYYNTLNLNDTSNFDIYTLKPDVLVHCGAMTHVDQCETEVTKSYEQTVQSTLNLLKLAKEINAKLVYLSTDYVFDGTHGPYRETDKTNPLSVYGQHKLEAEQAVISSGLPYLVLRVTNIYGDELRGKNFVARILQQCTNNQPLTLKLPYDQYASPTNAYDIARAMEILIKDAQEGLYHIGSTDYMNRVELAMRILKYFPEAVYDLQPMSTEALNQPAPRPLLGGFVKSKFSNQYPTFIFTTVQDYIQQQLNS